MMHTAVLYSLALLVPSVQDSIPELIAVESMQHEKQIRHLAVDSKAKTLVTIQVGELVVGAPSGHSAMRAWKIKNGKPLWETRLSMASIVDMGIGAELIATSWGIGVTELNSLKNGEREKAMGGPNVMSKFKCIVIDPKDRWVWMGSEQGGLIRVTPGDINGWSKRGLENTGTTSMALDAKGKQLAIGGKDGSIRFVNPVGGKVDENKVFQIHDSPVTALAYDLKGSKLIAGSAKGNLCMLAVSRGKRLFDIQVHGAEICAIAVDPKRRWIATGDKDGVILLWNYKDGEEAATLKCQPQGPVAGLAFVDKGKRLIGTSGGKQILIWDLSGL